MEQRIRRIMSLRSIDRETAKRDVEETDRERTEFFRVNYNVNWFDLRLYDLVINSGGREYEAIAEEICMVARQSTDRAAADAPDHPIVRR